MARSELTVRVLFSLVAAPIVLGAVWWGDWALAALLAIVAAVAAWEFCRIARAGGYTPVEPIAIGAAALLPLLIHAAYLGLVRPAFTWIPVLAIVTFAVAVVRRGPGSHPLGAVAVTALGILYTGGFLSYGYALRYHPYAVGGSAGAALLGLPLLLTWASDIGGYVVGRAVGRHKLIPSVSPGKTVEGAVGALLIAALVAWAYQTWLLTPLAHLALQGWSLVLFGLLVSVAVQTGDLAESMLKREAGVKDSSRVFPGHGGVLDRIDGLLFALPVSFWLLDVLRLVPVPVVR